VQSGILIGTKFRLNLQISMSRRYYLDSIWTVKYGEKVEEKYTFKINGIQSAESYNNSSNVGFGLIPNLQYFEKTEYSTYSFYELVSWILAMLAFFELLARLIIFLAESFVSYFSKKSKNLNSVSEPMSHPSHRDYALLNSEDN